MVLCHRATPSVSVPSFVSAFLSQNKLQGLDRNVHGVWDYFGDTQFAFMKLATPRLFWETFSFLINDEALQCCFVCGTFL